jgi:zinc protease
MNEQGALMGVTTHRLTNGLTVMVKEWHAAPVAACCLGYAVGARDEQPGQAGISHWLEHLMFRGTARYPRGQLDRLIPRNGGSFNAFTTYDYTAYYVTMPAASIVMMLSIEADRMTELSFTDDDVANERSVILAERAGLENDPDWWLGEAVQAAVYDTHPYRNPVIGWREDLARIGTADLRQHYQAFYQPGNAVLALVGAVDAAQVIDAAEAAFGSIADGAVPRPVIPADPWPTTERRVTVRRPGVAPALALAFRVPDCRHPDLIPLLVLDGVLSGAGGTNRSARLYRALVERRYATAAGSSVDFALDQGTFQFGVTLHQDQAPEVVERVLRDEIDRVQQEPVAEHELARVRKQVRAQRAFAGESVTNQAINLASWHILGIAERGERLADEIAAVSSDDVLRVARQYLDQRRGVVGVFIPEHAE